jgi:hypothetical protein
VLYMKGRSRGSGFINLSTLLLSVKITMMRDVIALLAVGVENPNGSLG